MDVLAKRALLAVFLSTVLCGPASAQSPWAGPVEMPLPPEAGEHTRPLAVEFTRHGNGLLYLGDNLDTRLYAPIRGGQVGAATDLGLPFGLPVFATYGRDRVVFAGTSRSRPRDVVMASFGRIGGRVGRPQRVSSGEFETLLGLDADPRGDIAILYSHDDQLRLAYKARNRPFRRTTRIDRVDAEFDRGDSEIAINERGDVLVVWIDREPARRPGRRDPSVVFARIVRADGRVERTDRVGIAAFDSDLSIDFTNARRALVAWGFSANGPGPGFGPLRAAYARKGGRFFRAQTLEPPAPGYAVPRVAFTSHGEGLVAWSRYDDTRVEDLPVVVRAATLEGSRFGAAQTLREKQFYPPAELVVGNRGEALVTWVEQPGDVFAAVRPPGSSFGAPEQVAGALENALPAIDPVSGVPFVFAGARYRGPLTYATRTPVGR